VSLIERIAVGQAVGGGIAATAVMLADQHACLAR